MKYYQLISDCFYDFFSFFLFFDIAFAVVVLIRLNENIQLALYNDAFWRIKFLIALEQSS